MEKKQKTDISESSTIESRLERFSDIWNDCPDVPNPMQSYSRSHDKPVKEYRSNSKLDSHQENVAKKRKLITSSEGPSSLPTKHDATLADLKRKKAVEDQRQQQLDKKNIIKQALSSLDERKKVNKKIVFSENCEEKTEIKSIKPSKNLPHQKTKLFDDEDNEHQTDIELKINRQFKGKKGQKLLELQSKYASDSRFSLDTRFYESGSEESEKEIDDNTENPDEKQKQLAILESIVQRQIKPLLETKKKSKSKPQDCMFVRFDPTREEHNKYVIKLQEKTTETRKDENTGNKKKRKKEMDWSKPAFVEENKTEVSKEKLFTLKEDFKEALKSDNGSGFSLLKLFGSKDTQASKPDEYENLDVKAKKHINGKSFKYDSSDSEPEEEQQKNQTKPPQVPWGGKFFIADDDPRLKGVLEFIKGADQENEEFAEKRKALKQFIRSKYKNNQRKKKMFKKKLGRVKIKK